jgi:hypothetical protein
VQNPILSIINLFPEGMLCKIVCFIFEKLIIKVPPEKQDEIRKAFAEFIIKLAEAIARGAAEGFAREIRDKYGDQQ